MPTKTAVKSVAVTAYCHSPLNQPKDGVKTAGNSEIKWTFKGTYLANNQCVVVVEAGEKRDKRDCKVNSGDGGGVFPAGTDGVYCELTLAGNDQDNWTLSVATDKDVSANEEVFLVGGTGKGGQ